MDPIKVATQGVRLFSDEGYDLVIIDTGGRHKLLDTLLVETGLMNEALVVVLKVVMLLESRSCYARD